MKDFFKYLLATIIGIFLCGFIFMVIGTASIIGIATSSSMNSTKKIKDKSVLQLNFNGSLIERSSSNPWDKLLGSKYSVMGLDDILSSIEKARYNDKIKGIYINASNLATGSASIKEIRDKLLDFKKSGKFLLAYSDSYSQGLYYLSSVADKIILNPVGSLDWKGLSAQPVFYKDLLDKIGVDIQIFKVGTYKSAVEPYILTEMSKPNREQVSAFLGSMWEQILDDVSTSRNISKSQLNTLADNLLITQDAQESLKSGLIDTLMYKSNVDDYIKNLLTLDRSDKINFLKVKDLINSKLETKKSEEGENKDNNKIAVYYAYGEIDGNTNFGENEGIKSDKVVKDLLKLKDNDDIKAVVLRVNSPGGSAFGSEQIWKAVTELKAYKPVIVSMGDYAASGGYYISCNANYIVAEPNTLTGSIGIFGMIPNIEKITKRIGVNFDVVKTNKFSDFGGINRSMNSDEKLIMQTMINKGYKLFTSRCSAGRKMDVENIYKIAEGRVWTGTMAKEIGLVDSLGGLDTAIQIAANISKISNYTVEDYPAKEDFLTKLLNINPEDFIESKILKSKLGIYFKEFSTFNNLANFNKKNSLLLIMPYDPNIR